MSTSDMKSNKKRTDTDILIKIKSKTESFNENIFAVK